MNQPESRISALTAAQVKAQAAELGFIACGITTLDPIPHADHLDRWLKSLPCGTDSGEGCAPQSERVDLAEPSFSNPTNVTNPLFPISQLHSAVLLGNIDGHLFRAETTLLPGANIIELNGQQVKALISQYTAYLDGRIHEVGLDWYVQADDGSVCKPVWTCNFATAPRTRLTWLGLTCGPNSFSLTPPATNPAQFWAMSSC